MSTNPIPGPSEIFGDQGITPEDESYRGSRFSETKAAVFDNPYQEVWGAPGASPLPRYRVTNRSVWAGALPGGRPPRFKLASMRALDSGADLRWGDDGRGFRRLVRPHGVCVTGRWEVTEDSPYSGYFSRGSRGLVIARISVGTSMTLRGPRRSFGMALKLYPTDDANHQEPLETANVLLADDLGGNTARRITDVSMTNAPQLTGWARGNQIPVLLMEGLAFMMVDRMPSMRQVYPIAELGKPSGEPTRAPEFMRLQATPEPSSAGGAGGDQDADDVRNQVLGHLFDPGDPTPRRSLTFELAVSDRGRRRGNALLPRGERQTITDWRTLGSVRFDDGVASYNGDFVLHFRHPTWRKDRNDPETATRKGGRKVAR